MNREPAAAPEPPRAADESPEQPPTPVRRARILVADDEDMVRELAISVLEAHGFETVPARHGGEALSIFHERSAEIDAVLLDMSMPVVDGAHVLIELRRENPRVPVVLTSGYDEPADAADPALSFLQKPYRAEHLISRLRTLLADVGN